MQSSLTYLIVLIGAGLGGALRHGVNVASLRVFGSGFPFGTLTVNVVGSLAMGLLGGYFALRSEPGQIWRLFLTTGVLGGFTTFSTFSLDSVLLYERGEIGIAVLYVTLSVGAALVGLFAGLFIIRHFA
ncbi:MULTISPECIES: fluoride efflux transporter CrcB [Aurantimonadaceae]|uniref:Fluoride-specific ion channel FluC n=1 Tax=Jiella pelagia TaxID=2986949 RepID=A0ABY7C642_9HYPH|nr:MULTISPECIES: fluoride efflux transporter CrcB [Aurantimonadaceae]MCK5934880.1 fluoride efflux transporter CrcB [Fulvimarina manganoxydans]ORE97044.1 camphor resistance protein CrcB [Aurantimonas sp. 22II-16-19i]WAP71519.1 fluoride efflux transporter CrcB [Jiella pelagia]